METNEMTISRQIAENIIEGLKNAATELEEFQVQLALGKAEAADKYEEIKKAFAKQMHGAKLLIEKGKGEALELKAIFEELELQLALGRADAKDVFDEQKKKIEAVLHKLEIQYKTSEFAREHLPALKEEFEKFKIKLNILYYQYDIDEKKKQFKNKVEELSRKILGKQPEPETKWDHFTREMGEAYDHLKRAFVKH